MMLRAIPSSFDPGILAAIDARLDAVERNEDVRILLAVESGSRAWGFPSPDSDYDCRFLFLRPRERYLSLWPTRDVIETPLDGDLDVNGWDLAKALRLIAKGNAVVLEWLRSPIVYRGDAVFRDALLTLADSVVDRRLIARHYLHLGERQRRVYFGDGRSVAVKKLFYALRPAAALRWLKLHADAAVPPMHFPTLMAECAPPAEVAKLAAELIERKAATREMGEGPVPEAIARFVDDEFTAARLWVAGDEVVSHRPSQVALDTFFQSVLDDHPRGK